MDKGLALARSGELNDGGRQADAERGRALERQQRTQEQGQRIGHDRAERFRASRDDRARFGVAEYGPADLTTPGAPRSINAGLFGEQANIEQTQRWLEAGRAAIAAKSADRPGLWPPFPGFLLDIEVIADPDEAQTVPGAIRAVLHAPDQLVERSKEIASHLSEIQSKVNSSGLLAVVSRRSLRCPVRRRDQARTRARSTLRNQHRGRPPHR
jgi:hypothetical protein